MDDSDLPKFPLNEAAAGKNSRRRLRQLLLKDDILAQIDQLDEHDKPGFIGMTGKFYFLWFREKWLF